MAKMPIIYYLIAAAIFGVLLFWRRKWDLSLLIAYMFLVLAYTVLKRGPGEELSYGMEPFWSYKAIFAGGFNPVSRKTLFIQILANVVMFIPIGFFAGRLLGWKGILLGFGCSALIELVQLITKRGLFEFDDIIHNTLGAAIGVGLWVLLRKAMKHDF